MRRRLLFVHHASSMGGAPTSLSLLIASLDRKKFEPFVLMPKRSTNGDVVQLFESSGANVIQEKNIRPFNAVNGCEGKGFRNRVYAFLSAPLTTFAVFKHVRRLRPSVIHTNTLVLPFALLGSFLANRRIPRLVHVREMRTRGFWGSILTRLNRALATEFIGIDESGLDALGIAAADRIVVYNSIPFADEPLASETVRSEERRRYGFDEQEIVFLSLSRITPSNGIVELIQLIREAGTRLNKNAVFVIAGFTPDESNAFQQEVQQLMDGVSSVQSLEFVENVQGALQACDVVVAPYVHAHGSRAILEGAACGRPALVTDLPNLLESIHPDRTGKSFRLSSLDDFVDAVNALCDERTRQQMGSEARKLATARYSQQANTRKVEMVYEQLIGSER